MRLRNANYKLVCDARKAMKMTSKPTFESFRITNDELAHKKKHVIHEHYRYCLLDEKTTSAQFWTIRSFAHQLTTYETNKTALSPFNDKRYLLGRDGRTLAYGHYKIACE